MKIWDASTGDIIHTFEGHTEGISDVAWSTNGEFLASASDDKTVRLWDMNDVRRDDSWFTLGLYSYKRVPAVRGDESPVWPHQLRLLLEFQSVIKPPSLGWF